MVAPFTKLWRSAGAATRDAADRRMARRWRTVPHRRSFDRPSSCAGHVVSVLRRWTRRRRHRDGSRLSSASDTRSSEARQDGIDWSDLKPRLPEELSIDCDLVGRWRCRTDASLRSTVSERTAAIEFDLRAILYSNSGSSPTGAIRWNTLRWNWHCVSGSGWNSALQRSQSPGSRAERLQCNESSRDP